MDNDLQFRMYNELSRVAQVFWDVGKVVSMLALHESVPIFSCVDFFLVQRGRWPGIQYISFVERSNLEFVVQYPV